MRTALALLALSLFAGCSSSPDKGPRVVAAASEDDKKLLWDPLVQLAGEWTVTDEKGNVVPALVIKLTSSGSVLHESMFPGTPHEMTNVYHLDGRSVVMTHYCAAGNQPRMRATEAPGGKFSFRSDSVTNLRAADEVYMGEVVLTITDKDHFEQEWISYKAGKEEPHLKIAYTRKK